MFGLKITGVKYEFDVDAYKTELMRNIEIAVKAAAKEFAKAALARIPIRTGFVAGSFGTLSDLLGSAGRFLPIVQFTRRLIRAAKTFLAKEGLISQGREYYYPESGGKVLKTPESGRQFATQSEDIFKWRDLVFVFTYAVDISYFRINDSIPGHAPTAPWHAFLAAQDAFEQYLTSVGLRFDIRAESFIKTVPI